MGKKTWKDMAFEAIFQLKNRNGSSLKAIRSYINTHFKANNLAVLKRALNKACESGSIVKYRSNYKLIQAEKKKLQQRLNKKINNNAKHRNNNTKHRKNNGKLANYQGNRGNMKKNGNGGIRNKNGYREDLALEKLERRRKNGLILPPRPKLIAARDTKIKRWSSKGGFVDDDDVADLLVCTSFINAFATPLGISPFNITQLRDALEYEEECTLLSEIHIVLLRLIIQSMPEESIEERRLSYLVDVLNGITWPEVLRTYISFWLRYGEYEKLQDKFDEFTRDALHDAIITLEMKEYFHLSTPEKLTVLQFLIDEALETPTIAEYINEHEMKMKELKVEKKQDDAIAKREMQRERRHEKRRLNGEDSSTSEESSSEDSSEDSSDEAEDGDDDDDDNSDVEAENKMKYEDNNSNMPDNIGQNVKNDASDGKKVTPHLNTISFGRTRVSSPISSEEDSSSSSSSEEDSSEDSSLSEDSSSSEDEEPPKYLPESEYIFHGDPNNRREVLSHRKEIEKKEVAIRDAYAAWIARQRKRQMDKKRRVAMRQRKMHEKQNAREKAIAILQKRKEDFEASLLLKERKREEAFMKVFAKSENILRAAGGPVGMDRVFNTYYFFPSVDKRKLYVLPGAGDGDNMPGSEKIGSETHWGIYEYQEDIDALIASLHPRGLREGKLLAKLTDKTFYNRLTSAMKSRKLENDKKVQELQEKRRLEKLEQKTKVEEDRQNLLIAQSSSKRAAAHNAVRAMVTMNPPRKLHNANDDLSQKKLYMDHLGWRNQEVDLNDFSCGSSPICDHPVEHVAFADREKILQCLKEYTEMFLMIAETYSIKLDNMVVNFEVTDHVSLPSNVLNSNVVAFDQSLINHALGEKRGILPETKNMESIYATNGNVANGENNAFNIIAADTSGTSILPATENRSVNNYNSMDTYEKFKFQISTTKNLHTLRSLLLAIEHNFYQHCRKANLYKRTIKPSSDVDMEEDAEEEDAIASNVITNNKCNEIENSDGEISEFEESDDEMYDDAGEESNYLWHDRSRREQVRIHLGFEGYFSW